MTAIKLSTLPSGYKSVPATPVCRIPKKKKHVLPMQVIQETTYSMFYDERWPVCLDLMVLK